MKKLIALIGLCMIAYVMPAVAETSEATVSGTEGAKTDAVKKHLSPEQISAKIDARLKKLEEHKARATSAGKTDIVNAIQNLEDALKNMKSAIDAKDKDAVKTARTQVKTARESLKNLLPDEIKEKIKERKDNKAENNG